jgi:hypothetical protein
MSKFQFIAKEGKGDCKDIIPPPPPSSDEESQIRAAIDPSILSNIKQKLQLASLRFKEKGIEDEDLHSKLNDAINTIDGYVLDNIRHALIKKFGGRQWKVELETVAYPTLRGSRRIAFKYIIKHVTWTDRDLTGPDKHTLFYFMKEELHNYMTHTEFNEAMFTRFAPQLTRRFISYFNPFPISGKRMPRIPVFISKIFYKSSDSKMKAEGYLLHVRDSKFLINDIKAKTIEDVLLILQKSIENIYYMKENNPEIRNANQYLMQKIVSAESSEANESVEADEAKSTSTKGDTEHDEEAQEISGTDSTEVRGVNTLPGEEPNFDMTGQPPSQEMIDHNYHDDQSPELEERAAEEAGEGSGGGAGGGGKGSSKSDEAYEADEAYESGEAVEANESVEADEGVVEADEGTVEE